MDCVTLRATKPTVPPSARRGSDRLRELAKQRSHAADSVHPTVIVPAILAVIVVALVQWWLFTGGTWTGRQPLTTETAAQSDFLLRYSGNSPTGWQPLLHGPGPAVLVMPFQWALHRDYLDEPISDQCILLIFAWGLTALVARWLCRLHADEAAESPVSLIVAGTLLGSLAVPWPSLLLHSDSTATAIASASFFLISGIYILWSNRRSPEPHLIPLLITGGCWLFAALSTPILLPTIIVIALLACPFALVRRRSAPLACLVILLPLILLAFPTLRPGTLADWRQLSLDHVAPNFRYLLARPAYGNWQKIFTAAPRLRFGDQIEPSVLLLQAPLLVALMFAVWGLIRTRSGVTSSKKLTPRIETLAPATRLSASEPSPFEQALAHDPDRILITPRKPTGASLCYTLAIDSPLKPEQEEYISLITPRKFSPATAAESDTRRIAPAEPREVVLVPANTNRVIGRVWLPLALIAAWTSATFIGLLMPIAYAPAFALTTQAAGLALVLVWCPFVARHKTRPAFRLAMSVALSLAMLTLFASYLSITLIPG